MPIRWIVDTEANLSLWRELSAMPLRVGGRPGMWIADLGGGNGNFARPLTANGARLLSIDVERAALKGAPARGVRPVAGSALDLPLKTGSLDGLVGRAVLHHVPDALDAALQEVRRVVKPGGLVLIQEPTNGNTLGNFARKRFPTERHDPHERPLPLDAYEGATRRHLEVLEVRPFFLLSYLTPHVVARLPPNRRRLGRAIAHALAMWDERLLAALPGLRARAAYVSILARRPS